MNQYKAILKDNIRQVFDDYIDALTIPEISYFAIGVQDILNKSSASLMSRIEWQMLFKALDYADHDPIRKAALSSQRNIIIFDEIDHVDNLGKEIMHQRKKFEMSKGVVIMERHLTYNYMLTLGTDYSKFDGREFLQKHYQAIQCLLADMKLIIEPIAKHYKTSYFANRLACNDTDSCF